MFVLTFKNFVWMMVTMQSIVYRKTNAKIVEKLWAVW